MYDNNTKKSQQKNKDEQKKENTNNINFPVEEPSEITLKEGKKKENKEKKRKKENKENKENKEKKRKKENKEINCITETFEKLKLLDKKITLDKEAANFLWQCKVDLDSELKNEEPKNLDLEGGVRAHNFTYKDINVWNDAIKKIEELHNSPNNDSKLEMSADLFHSLLVGFEVLMDGQNAKNIGVLKSALLQVNKEVLFAITRTAVQNCLSDESEECKTALMLTIVDVFKERKLVNDVDSPLLGSAIFYTPLEFVKYIVVGAGADPCKTISIDTTTGDFTGTALHIAVAAVVFNESTEEVSLDTIKYLLKEHADLVNEKNKDGDTALHLVCQSSGGYYYEIVKILLKHGAKINIKNGKDKTVLDLFIENKSDFPNVLKFLRKELDPPTLNYLTISEQNYLKTSTDNFVPVKRKIVKVKKKDKNNDQPQKNNSSNISQINSGNSSVIVEEQEKQEKRVIQKKNEKEESEKAGKDNDAIDFFEKLFGEQKTGEKVETENLFDLLSDPSINQQSQQRNEIKENNKKNFASNQNSYFKSAPLNINNNQNPTDINKNNDNNVNKNNQNLF